MSIWRHIETILLQLMIMSREYSHTELLSSESALLVFPITDAIPEKDDS